MGFRKGTTLSNAIVLSPNVVCVSRPLPRRLPHTEVDDRTRIGVISGAHP